MIEGLSNYAFSLVSAIFILNIVQMILPESKNRKYILFVSSMIVTIILIEPIINLINGNIDVSNILNENQKELLEISDENYSRYYEDEVVRQYKENIEFGIINRLEQMGYETKVIRCEYDEITLEPKYLYLELTEKYDGGVVPVKIEVSSNLKSESGDMSIMDKLKIKETLKKEYGIDELEVIEWTN